MITVTMISLVSLLCSFVFVHGRQTVQAEYGKHPIEDYKWKSTKQLVTSFASESPQLS